MASVRRFFIRTYGCQMNAHDTEKLANLLYHQGYVEVAASGPGGSAPDQHLLDPGEGRASALHRPGDAPPVEGRGAGPGARGGRLRRPAGGGRDPGPLWPPGFRLRYPQSAPGAGDDRGGPLRNASGPHRNMPLPGPLRSARATSRIRNSDPWAGAAHGDGRLRHVLQLLHRADHPRTRDQPAGRGHRPGVRISGRPGRARDHAAGAGGERLRSSRSSPRAGSNHRHHALCAAPEATRADPGDRTTPLHQPPPACSSTRS